NYLGTVKNVKAALAPYQAKKAFKTFKDGDVIQGIIVINTHAILMKYIYLISLNKRLIGT
ncbi:Zn-dependent hydrolase, partial [Acinetobacter nosocomialis P020]